MSAIINPSEILIVKLSAIGDTIHAVPAVAALKTKFPDCTITWCVEAGCSPLVECLDCVDRVLTIHTRTWRRGKNLFGQNGIFRFLGNLRSRKFEVSIDFQGLVKSAVVSFLSGASLRLGWGKAFLRESGAAMFYHVRINGIPSDAHVIEWCSALVAPLGVKSVSRRFPFSLPDASQKRVDVFLSKIDHRPFVILNPGGGWPTKRWEPEKYGRLAEKITDELGVITVITTGPGEDDLLDKIQNISSSAVYASMDLLELAALCGKATCFVGGDTGPMHIASAMGTPVVALFGPSSPTRNGPFHQDDIVVSKELPCSGCYKRRCPHFICMDFPVDDVFNAVIARLEKEKRSAH